jgi:hypothetical protein
MKEDFDFTVKVKAPEKNESPTLEDMLKSLQNG